MPDKPTKQMTANKPAVLLVFLALILSGCHARPKLSNEEIVRRTQVCTSAGLRAVALWDGDFTYAYVSDVICEPRP